MEKQQPVLVYPHPNLSIVSKEVDLEDRDHLITLADQLIITMYRLQAGGLAAPQIDVPERMICVLLKDDTPEILVNPKITDREEETVHMVEGCLSLPHVKAKLKHRNKAVMVEAYDQFGTFFKKEYWDREAVALLHEFDHLEGITIMDHMSGIQRMMSKTKLKKFKKKLRKSDAYKAGKSPFILE